MKSRINSPIKIQLPLDSPACLFTGSILILFFVAMTFLIPGRCMAYDVDLTEMSLEELMDVKIRRVVSASKYEQKTIEAPSSITIVTGEEINHYGYRTLGELLRSVRGFHITNDRNYSYAGFRGFNRPGDYSTRILLLLDGIRINENIYDSAAVGSDFTLDMDLIRRVEIVRGPSYALYGNNAFFVVVNVITKDADRMEGFEAAVDAGSDHTYGSRLSFGKVFEDAGEMVLSGSLFDSEGRDLYFSEFDTPDQNNGLAQNADRDHAGNFFAKYRRGDLTFTGGYVKRSKQIPTASWGTVFNDPRNKSWDERAFIDLKMERSLNAHLDVAGRLTYGFYTYEGIYPFDDEEAGTRYLNRDDTKGEWWGADFQLVRVIGKHTLLAGGEVRDNFTLNQKNFDEDGTVYLDDRRDTFSWGMFIQDEYSILESLKLNAGLRYDHFSTFGESVNPRFALIYRPVPATAIKYLGGTAYRAPNAYELYYNDGDITQKANPNLENERIASHEIVWEQIFSEIYTGTLSLYRHKIEDLISLTTDEDDLLVFINQDQVDAKGIEAEVNAVFPGGVKTTLSYAIQKSDFKQKDLNWTNSPGHLAKFNLSLPLVREKWVLGIEEQYTGDLETLGGNSTGNYFLTHVTLFGKNLLPQLDISGSLYNLFDEAYGFPGSDEHLQDVIEQDGRSFRIKVIYRF